MTQQPADLRITDRPPMHFFSNLRIGRTDEDTAQENVPAALLKRESRAKPSVSAFPNHVHRPSRPVLARSPSRDPWRHGCRHGADKDVLAACPAMVGGQGPCANPQTSRFAINLSISDDR
ncbi:hypothetical protein [Xanthomonas oryzae pv. oryzae MAFF 311018]|nr:hypothetical protein [Xanthomonas oryzae pv. oryzae MAFF 311018]